MRFFCCLIFLSCIFVKESFATNDNNYILCTSCSIVNLPFSHSLTFPSACQNDDNLPTNIYGYALACNIKYHLDYNTEQINIIFNASNDTSVFEGQKPSEYLIQEIKLDLRNNSNQQNEIQRTYGCNIKDNCARDFYLETIGNLVTGVQSQLDSIRRKLQNDTLLIGNNSQRRCINSSIAGNKQSRRCQFGLCYANYTNYPYNHEQNSKTQRCDSDNSPIVNSYIKYHEPKSIGKDKETLEYRCNKNVCNRNDRILKIQSIITEFTKWNSTISKPVMVIEKKANSSMKQTIASYIVVLFLIFIQIFI
ncbi:unnamed protein product [Rotaria magnacalcarata]|uniref:Uncharacterized protein n=1 Tax=Rotaria magnacalcarata TaxID=392030 RepID=A0A816WQ99_9BILA|nr:unnamed protein product [Rotaria magnacalcarata]CAF2137127.1 unnamed protein product [Rotaria magnacalcarata]CAF3797227.1 unnamed protein product [Rotaria magnacalcarata]CAF3805772.1 unnamed protein product [Rotaria magnacalcarata]CAF3844547.1 unnamed protein product [Rotaria magnacalcarata]